MDTVTREQIAAVKAVWKATIGIPQGRKVQAIRQAMKNTVRG